jgi:hypothetical protein
MTIQSGSIAVANRSSRHGKVVIANYGWASTPDRIKVHQPNAQWPCCVFGPWFSTTSYRAASHSYVTRAAPPNDLGDFHPTLPFVFSYTAPIYPEGLWLACHPMIPPQDVIDEFNVYTEGAYIPVECPDGQTRNGFYGVNGQYTGFSGEAIMEWYYNSNTNTTLGVARIKFIRIKAPLDATGIVSEPYLTGPTCTGPPYPTETHSIWGCVGINAVHTPVDEVDPEVGYVYGGSIVSGWVFCEFNGDPTGFDYDDWMGAFEDATVSLRFSIPSLTDASGYGFFYATNCYPPADPTTAGMFCYCDVITQGTIERSGFTWQGLGYFDKLFVGHREETGNEECPYPPDPIFCRKYYGTDYDFDEYIFEYINVAPPYLP